LQKRKDVNDVRRILIKFFRAEVRLVDLVEEVVQVVERQMIGN
jgi:hypothetical protein